MKKILLRLGLRQGKHYHKAISITDFAKFVDVDIRWEDNGPWIDDVIWNSSKAYICNIFKINLMIDDNIAFGRYFDKCKTEFVLYEEGEEAFITQVINDELI